MFCKSLPTVSLCFASSKSILLELVETVLTALDTGWISTNKCWQATLRSAIVDKLMLYWLKSTCFGIYKSAWMELTIKVYNERIGGTSIISFANISFTRQSICIHFPRCVSLSPVVIINALWIVFSFVEVWFVSLILAVYFISISWGNPCDSALLFHSRKWRLRPIGPRLLLKG